MLPRQPWRDNKVLIEAIACIVPYGFFRGRRMAVN
jgi:hypothetical protein